MANKVDVEFLKKRQNKLMADEQVLRKALESVRSQQNKLQVERLQLEFMIGSIQSKKIDKPITTPVRFEPLSEDPEKDINEQEIELNPASSLQSMFAGTFSIEEEDEEDEDEDEVSAGMKSEKKQSEDDDEDDLDTLNPSKQQKIDDVNFDTDFLEFLN